MCEAHVFLLREGKEELILENVDSVEIEDDKAKLVNIFGEQKEIRARMKLYSNPERKIVFESL